MYPSGYIYEGLLPLVESAMIQYWHNMKLLSPYLNTLSEESSAKGEGICSEAESEYWVEINHFSPWLHCAFA